MKKIARIEKLLLALVSQTDGHAQRRLPCEPVGPASRWAAT